MELLGYRLKNKNDKIMKNKFTWGDAVIIIQHDTFSCNLHMNEFASVCGFYRIISEETAKTFRCNIGDWVYTVEFSDGSDMEVAEPYLEKYINHNNL